MSATPFNTDAYRYPSERLVLAGTLALAALILLATATATLCASVLFVLAALALSYSTSRSHHRTLIQRASRLTPQRAPALYELARQCTAKLRPGAVDFFVVPSKVMNAYTFGLESPKVVVLYSALLEVMDADELRFIIGHELGHVRLGHTWLNSLAGGLAGIPSATSVGALVSLSLLGWNRACEYSADRAGLLACGKPEKAITALVKLVAGPSGKTAAGLELAYWRIDAEDDTWLGSLGETLSTHPMLIRRIQKLRAYAQTAEYRHLQEAVNRNL